MKHYFLLMLAVAALAACAPAVRAAGGTELSRPSGVAVPVVDTFEDGDFRLRLIAMPSPDQKATEVTLIYEDRAQRTLRAVTVRPDAVVKDDVFATFLNTMDADFVSYVRASLADRLLHLSGMLSTIDRAESALFLGGSAADPSVALHGEGVEAPAE